MAQLIEVENPSSAAEDNGNEVSDAVVGASEPEAEQQPKARGLYFVRIPKPKTDDIQEIKNHQGEFQALVAKLKAMNAKLTAKRDEVRGFRRQMGEARGLKETSEPEYQEKLERIKQLKDLRGSYVSKIQDIKSNIQGLDVKSEEELEAKIKELENRIAHEGLPLREEKQLVQQISKLNQQRGKVREYDTHKASLAELESESSKIKAIINDMENEFKVIKSERDAANKIVQDIYAKLKDASSQLQELEAEHAELVNAKEEAVKALEAAREESNANAKDYRENRKFSLEVRDLVAAGRVDEAKALVAAQVEEWTAKLVGDASLRQEYTSLWTEQRRYMVSELLPGSSLIAQQEAKAAAGKAPAGKGAAGKGGAAAKAPPVPRGAEKAKSIIDSIMAEASREAKARAGAAAVVDEDSGDADEEDEVAAAPAAPAAAAKKAEPYRPPGATAAAGAAANGGAPARLVQDPAAAAAQAFNFKVELPKVETEEFVPPVIKEASSEADEAAKKEALREEQRRKAAEAEERKKKRAETAERKRILGAEAAKRAEQEKKEKEAAARAAAASKAAAAQAAAAAKQAEQEAAEAAAAAEREAAGSGPESNSVSKGSAPTPWEKRQRVAAAKRPKVSSAQNYWKMLLKMSNDPTYQKIAGVGLFVVVMFLLVLMALRSS